MNGFIFIFCFGVLFFQTKSFATQIKCQKEAEAIGISNSRKKGNLPKNLLSIANPTEIDGADLVVYVGARSNYNYFKLKLDKNCKLIKVVDVEYAE